MNKVELDPDSSPAAKFGSDLRSAREARGWTQEELAHAIGYSPTHVSAVETGRRPPTARLARELDKAFGFENFFVRKSRDLKSSTILEGFPEYVAHESRAVELRLFDLGIVPGLLQTMDYARAIAAGAARRGSITEDQAEERVTYLARRQANLRRESPPLIHAVLDESCIRRPVGGETTMAAQLDELAAFARMPNTVLQVAPFAMGEERAFDLPVNILTLPDRSLMSYAESAHQGHLERDSGAVPPMLTAYYQLQALALSQAESVALISQLREELP
ncbi:transcriptional regulator with XRE-family HTH domain [Kitasatospora sp. MAA19]|uniref:helix-turn-helix domain-containing protein n=1 Tax=Kitasatospora sp. MAA19 TaxID=3035090 RepID=UPI002475DBD2|nr:helix-turn-helix transcriptional regulator [Kitasatospora sp. MAA19]MDH6707010.1 transcriptional regulator with XRE-family HTH domain [Kitasatospora sp. MAA19]